MKDNYEIRNEFGGKFCERYKDKNGEIVLKTKNCIIYLSELERKAYNPSEACGKRSKRLNQSTSCKLEHPKEYSLDDEMVI